MRWCWGWRWGDQAVCGVRATHSQVVVGLRMYVRRPTPRERLACQVGRARHGKKSGQVTAVNSLLALARVRAGACQFGYDSKYLFLIAAGALKPSHF